MPNRYTCVNPGACDCGRSEGEFCRHWPDSSGASVPREQYERVVAALDQAVETLDLATAALSEDKLPRRAILTAKLLDATRALRESVGVAIAGGDRG